MLRLDDVPVRPTGSAGPAGTGAACRLCAGDEQQAEGADAAFGLHQLRALARRYWAVPLGVMEFKAGAASAVGQKPFHLDLRCLAQVSLTKRWLPDLERPGQGIVGTASVGLQQRIDALLSALVTRNRDLIEVRGPR